MATVNAHCQSTNRQSYLRLSQRAAGFLPDLLRGLGHFGGRAYSGGEAEEAGEVVNVPQVIQLHRRTANLD